jgi:hypothetical protein
MKKNNKKFLNWAAANNLGFPSNLKKLIFRLKVESKS